MTTTASNRRTRKPTANAPTHPVGMSRAAAVAYLQLHGVYAGHSRDSHSALVALVQAHQAAEPQLESDRTKRLAAAKAEHKLLQTWIKDGSNPPRPATPNLDALEAESNGSKPKARKAAAKPAAPATTVRFFRNDKPMPDSQNSLASVAYQCTAGINGDRPRISTGELRSILDSLGVTEPSSTTWKVQLPNGVVVETRPL